MGMLESKLLHQALEMDKTVADEEEMTWPLVVDDGAMFSLCRLVSEGKASPYDETSV